MSEIIHLIMHISIRNSEIIKPYKPNLVKNNIISQFFHFNALKIHLRHLRNEFLFNFYRIKSDFKRRKLSENSLILVQI